MIFYAAVANGQIILAQCNLGTDPFSDIAEKVLASISHLSGQKLKNSFNAEDYRLHCLINPDVTCLVIAEPQYSLDTAYKFLEEVHRRFSSSSGLVARSKNASVLLLNKDFAPVLESLIIDYSSGPKSAGAIGRANQQVNDVKQIMIENIDKAIQRGEELENLADKTENLNNETQLCSSNPLPIASSSHFNHKFMDDPELQLDRIASQINQISTSARSFSRSRTNKLKNSNINNSLSTTQLLSSRHNHEKMQGVRIKFKGVENFTDAMFRQNLESAIPVKPSRENTATAKVVLPKEDKKERKVLKHINFSTGNKSVSSKSADTEKGAKTHKNQALKGCLKSTSISSPSEQSDLLVDHVYRDSLLLSAKNGMGLLSSSSEWGDSKSSDRYDAASHSRSHSNSNLNSRPVGDFLYTPKGDQPFNANYTKTKPCNRATASSLSSTPNSDELQSLSNSNSTSAAGSYPATSNSYNRSCKYNFYPRGLSRSPNSCITTSSGGIEDNQSQSHSQSPFHTSYSLTSSLSPVDTYHPPMHRPPKGCKSRFCDACYATDGFPHNSFRSRTEPGTVTGNGGNNCLHAAVEENNSEAVWLLINKNFDVLQTNRNGETPGDLAGRKGNNTLRMLLELAEKLQQRTRISDEMEKDLFNVNFKCENLKRKLHSVSNENAQLKHAITQLRNEIREIKPTNLENTHSQMESERFYRMHVPTQSTANPEEFLTENSNRGNYSVNRIGYTYKKEAQGKEVSVDEGYPSSGELLTHGTERENDGFRRALSTSDSRCATKTTEDMSISHGIYNL